MNDDARPGEVFEVEPTEAGGAIAYLPWWLILTVAVIVTELTAHPSIGVVVFCLKFGWDDFRTALWLRRRDPDRRRGSVCSWFYLSSGLWRVCLWSFALIFFTIFIVLATAQRAQPANPPNADPEDAPEVITCVFMWLGSLAAATVLTAMAICIAWRRNVRVWISKAVSISRRINQWPPRPVPHAETNLLRWWMLVMGIGTCVFLVVGSVMVFLLILDAVQRVPLGGNNQGADAEAFAFLFGAVIPVGSGILIHWGGTRVLARIEAASPEYCWPSAEWTLELDSSD